MNIRTMVRYAHETGIVQDFTEFRAQVNSPYTVYVGALSQPSQQPSTWMGCQPGRTLRRRPPRDWRRNEKSPLSGGLSLPTASPPIREAKLTREADSVIWSRL